MWLRAQGSNVFFNCCLDKGAPRLSSQGQNPCKFKRLLMGLFSSWTSCLHRFVSFDHCCILLKRRPRTRDRVQILPRTNSNAQKIRNIFARIGKEQNLQLNHILRKKFFTTFLSPSGDLGIGLVWHNQSPPHPGPTFWSHCWNPLQTELNFLWGVLSCSQDDIRWF